MKYPCLYVHFAIYYCSVDVAYIYVHMYVCTYMCIYTYIYVGVIPLRKTAGVVENSGILCSFHWIKLFFDLCFTA